MRPLPIISDQAAADEFLAIYNNLSLSITAKSILLYKFSLYIISIIF